MAKARQVRVYEAVEALMRLSELALRRRRKLAREAGLSDRQWRVLEEIHDEHFLPSLFARGNETSPAAVSRTLRELEAKGLARAVVDGSDARQRRFRTTARGRRAIERLRAEREAALSAAWSDLASGELERFTAFARELADRLEALSPRAGDDR